MMPKTPVSAYERASALSLANRLAIAQRRSQNVKA